MGGVKAENERSSLQEEIWEQVFDEKQEKKPLYRYFENIYWREKIEYNIEDLETDYS